MIKNIEVEKSKIDFKSLYLIKEINIDTVTFIKYETDISMSMMHNDTHSNVVLKDIIGTETFRASIDSLIELAGKTGILIKGFEIEKIKKRVEITKINWL